MFKFFGLANDILAPRKYLLLACCGALFCACLFFVSRMVVLEDIRTMLPEDSGHIASDLELLRMAPFAQRLTITVSHPGTDPIPAATALADAMRREGLFTRVLTGPPGEMPFDFLSRLLTAAPALLTDADMAVLGARIELAQVQASLQRAKHDLLSPGGEMLKGIIRRDPLKIRDLILPKLACATRLADVRVVNGNFVSHDGKHALVMADTDIPVTDSIGAAKVMAAYQNALAALPQGAHTMLVGGHRHAEANAQAIKADLRVILPASAAALALIFFLFMRNLQSLYVFLVPVWVVGVAGAATAALHGSISGIVLGFGAVILGITVDYALHVFFALQHPADGDGMTQPRVLADVAPPIIFGALTSGAAFMALLVSDIPGIRQLAVFSLFSIVLALLLSFFVLPHFITPRNGTRTDAPVLPPTGTGTRGRLTMLWLLLIAAGLWAAVNTPMDGDLRGLGYTPAQVRSDEDDSRRIWGNMRDMAMVFSRGGTLDAALAENDKVWNLLRNAQADGNAASLAPLLPSAETQVRNIAGWNAFWRSHKDETLALIDAEGARLGFSAAAFDPFSEFVTASPVPVLPAFLNELGLLELMNMLTARNGPEFLALTLLPDTRDNAALFDQNTEQNMNTRFVSGSRFRAMLGDAMRSDIMRFSAGALAAVALLTAALLREARRTLLALLPIGAGLTMILGAMQLFGQAMNLFHVVSLPLVIGLGADYGIFMVSHKDPATRRRTARAVLFSGLTTLGGFGALVLARHPALHSIGITVLIGIGGAMATALWVVPRLDGGRA
jgi:predicted exporter